MRIFKPEFKYPLISRIVLTKTSTQNVTNASGGDPVTWDAVEGDNLGLVDLGASSTRITFPSDWPQFTRDGTNAWSGPLWIQAVAYHYWPGVSGTNGGFASLWWIDGSVSIPMVFSNQQTHGVASVVCCNTSTLWHCPRGGEYLESVVSQNTGGTVALQTSGDPGQTHCVVCVYSIGGS